ncbi:uncharacterized protein A1O9_12515 [Exophiala aquamarina CBS 119918]|uniref:Zn(2)-C6 fungal-type domain-containing protein n=1 Tax=Exophiala aquamarina CBS 119918 TaxID=1182545 RepID=A0A072NUS7_9EURO|nr:uncharacterized protein A1O9_12515 [Exophiala aquamarina CBS 119918]KEF51366.1 hypothetical protein A1O9_12515 [Exophiala aquamarina CBS 119918]
MVYPGHPSRGCFACRRKKVKCDEAKPQCNRCTRVGKICPGYRADSELSFRFVKVLRSDDSSSNASSRSSPDRQFKNNGGALAIPGADFGFQDDSFSNGSQRAWETSNGDFDFQTPIIQPLLLPWAHLALPLFINLYSTSSVQDPKQGLLTFLPSLYANSNPGSPLHLAVSAATDANAVRKLTDLEAIHQARRTHVKALVAVQKAIEDPQEVTKDTTLCSLFILTLFEYISGDTMEAHGSHIAGYEALLDLRSRSTNHESQEYALDLSVATQIVVKHLRSRTAPKPRTIQILEGLDKSDPSTVAIQINLMVAQYNNQIDTLVEAAVQAEQAHPGAGTATPAMKLLYSSILHGEQLDSQAHTWPDTLAEPGYAYQPAMQPLSGWPGPFDVYTALGVANDWNMVRCARIMLLMSIVKCCRFLREASYGSVETEEAFERSKSKIATLLDDIVASLPYCLGRGDAKWNLPVSGIGTSGFALLWPTGILLRCPFARPEQKAKALEMIEYIGVSLGLQRALFLKENWERGVFR